MKYSEAAKETIEFFENNPEKLGPAVFFQYNGCMCVLGGFFNHLTGVYDNEEAWTLYHTLVERVDKQYKKYPYAVFDRYIIKESDEWKELLREFAKDLDSAQATV